MNGFTIAFFMIVVGIPVVLGIGGDVLKRWIKYKERELELTSAQTAEKAAQYAAHTERLEQRVRVLERIVTDKGIVVAEEIERLRDDRPN
jgi:Tfp pilus assembly major pilin PilA